MEKLKSFNEINHPDFRSKVLRGDNIKEHYQRVQKFKLHTRVPDNIKSYFATAQNILLYTWYAFDLYPVAELRVLVTLELALQERIGEKELKEIRLRDKKKNINTGMQSYIQCVIKNEWVKNEDFSAWHRAPINRALHVQSTKAIQLMEERGVTELEADEVELLISEENVFDFLDPLLNLTNKVRNVHAHGGILLNPAEVWNNFEMVTEFINALFQPPEN